MINEIADNIKVIASFGPDGVKPLIFLWEKRRYTVTQVTATWTQSEGLYKEYLFAVQTDQANVYELAFNSGRLIWRLVRIYTDG